MPHRHNPGVGVKQGAPFGNQQIGIALHCTGQESHPHRNDQKQEKKRWHHNLVDFLDPLDNPAGEDHHRQKDDRDMPGDIAKRPGHTGKKMFCILREKAAGDCPGERAQHPADDYRITNRDAERPEQRDCAQNFSTLPAAGFHRVVIGANRACTGQPPEGKLTGKPHCTKKCDEQKIRDQECGAAVLPKPVREHPDISHPDRGAYRRHNKPDPAAELPILRLMAALYLLVRHVAPL